MRPNLNKLRTLCLFCDPSAQDQADQILLRSDNFYIFAGLGAILEGYLIITSHSCKAYGGVGSSISELPLDLLDELVYLRGIVSAFYTETYGHPGLSFEHGRVGGCLGTSMGTRHCYHPHLCCYPGTVNEGTGFKDQHGKFAYLWKYIHRSDQKACHGLHAIPAITGNIPYLYVEHYDVEDESQSHRIQSQAMIFPVPDEDELNAQFLRRKLAQLVGQDDKWDWSVFPTEEHVHRVINAFRCWLEAHAATYGVEFIKGKPPSLAFEASVNVITTQVYDTIASQFRDVWEGKLQYNTLGRFLCQLPLKIPGETIRVLDVGCGPGLYSKVFTDIGFNCVAVDPSKNMLQEVKRCLDEECNANSVTLVQAKVEDLANAIIGNFDAIWFSAVLLHIPRRSADRILDLLVSFLTDTGVLYTSVRLFNYDDEYDIPSLEMRPEGRVFVYYQRSELEMLFATAGLQILQAWETSTSKGTFGEESANRWYHYLLGK